MQQIVSGKLYNTKNAELIADDRYWDGRNWERNGRNRYLYVTKKGNFFIHVTTLWGNEDDHIEPVSRDQAKRLYEELLNQKMTYREAFGESPVEA